MCLYLHVWICEVSSRFNVYEHVFLILEGITNHNTAARNETAQLTDSDSVLL